MGAAQDAHQGVPEHVEVAVVGAGPIGLVAALLLADAGVSVTVVEKATAPGDLPRAISLQDESFRTFEQIGVADALKAESLLDTGSRYLGLGGTLLAQAKPVPSRIGHPAKTQFDQPILEQLLFDRAVEHPGVDFRLGHEATQIAQDTDRVLLTVTGPEGEAVIEADWLLGADGGRSFVRSALDIKLEGTTQPQRWIVIDLLNETAQHDPYAVFHCDGERPYVLVPGVDGRLRLEYMLFDDEDADAMTTPEKIRELVRPFRAELKDEDVRRAAVYVAHQRVAETYRRGRCFLIGDAAHLMPPFAGQGLNAGVRDATNIAWKLVEAVRGGATEALLDSYGTERRTHGAAMVKISQRIGAVVMATHPVLTRARDLFFQAVRRVPRVHDYLANMRFISPPDYSDGVAVPGGPALDSLQVGRALAQPQVRTAPDADPVGLDRVLGHGWAVLGLGADADPAGLDPYFAAIGAVPVRLVGPGVSTAGEVTDTATAVVSEAAPTLTAGAPAAPVYALIRPDKYVAAVFTAQDQQRVVAGLRRFVDDRLRAPAA